MESSLSKQEIEPENDIRVIISQDNDPALLDALNVEAGSEIPLVLSYSRTAILDQNAILEQLSAESGDNFCYLAVPITHPEIKLMFDPFKEEDARMLSQIYNGDRDSWMNKTADHFCLNYAIEINKVIKAAAPTLLIYDGHLIIGNRLAHIPCSLSNSYPEVFYHDLSLDNLYGANMELVSRLVLPNASRYIQSSSSSWRIVRRSWYQFQECLRARKNPGYQYFHHVDAGRDLF